MYAPLAPSMEPLYKGGPYRDLERGTLLYPSISHEENLLRWAFIRKVYSILSLQLILTAVIASAVTFYHPVALFFVGNPGLVIFVSILPFILICSLYYYHQSHPANLILLALFTACLSLSVGMTCAFTKGKIVWESAVLTAIVVSSLTMYTFWAAERGHDFSFLGPILFTTLVVIIVFLIIQLFFPIGRIGIMIYGGVASILFSAFIIYDTDHLIKRYTYDEYIWASVALYLDIINLFLSIVTLCRAADT